MRDVRVCQWNTLSLSGGRQKGGRERGGEAGGGTVPGNSGSRSDAGGGKRLGRWLLVAHWRCTEAFDLSLSLSLSFRPSRLASSFSVSSFNSSFPSNSSGSLFFCTAVPPSRPFRSPRVRARAHGRTRGNPGEPLHRLSPLRVCSSGFDRARHRSLHPLGISRSLPFSLPFISPLPSHLPPPSPRRRCSLLRPAFIPQQNLRDCSGRRR